MKKPYSFHKVREGYDITKNLPISEKISLDILIELARFYGTSVDYLLDITDERKPYPPKSTK